MNKENFTEQQIKDLSVKRNKYDLNCFLQCNYKIHSESWFNECFKNVQFDNKIKD